MAKFPWKLAAGAAAVVAGVAWLGKKVVGGGVSGGCTDEAYRTRVVAAARGQIGRKDLAAYLADAAPAYAVSDHPEWCGIFALWCLHQAGLARDKTWQVGLGFLLTSPRPMPTTSDPKPGDIAYFEHFQHQAVVLSVDGDNVELANGNGQGGVVSLSTTQKSHAKAFYSIAPHIAAAQAAGCPGA